MSNQKVIAKILGPGCLRCNKLERATKTALEQLGIEYELEHVTSYEDIASYGVMSTPGLVINGEVVSYGKLLSIDEIKELLTHK